VVESSTLLKCRRGNLTEGSNPSLSASFFSGLRLRGRNQMEYDTILFFGIVFSTYQPSTRLLRPQHGLAPKSAADFAFLLHGFPFSRTKA
jgi:hypothetical protein